jgi:predicted dehydrogenase
MKTIRWGMIGCGDVAEVKSGPGLYKADHSSLVAVMRRNGALAADYARRHGVAHWTDDAEAIIQAPDIDAVYIATLTDSHRDYTRRCARAGKAVYVEKPMVMRHAECVEMIGACRDAARVSGIDG